MPMQSPRSTEECRGQDRAGSGGDDEEVLTARILEVSSIVEASRYRIWTEVDNQPGRGGYKWLLRPGAEAKMVITKNPRAAAYSPR
jgi:hypothetical protein